MSHHRANVSSQLPNWTLSQPSQQGAGNSRLQTNVSSQLPSQTSFQRRQRRSGRISTHHWFVDALGIIC